MRSFHFFSVGNGDRAALLGGRSLSTFVRSLHHFKIVYRPGGQLEAKAYLAGNHHWHTPTAGK